MMSSGVCTGLACGWASRSLATGGFGDQWRSFTCLDRVCRRCAHWLPDSSHQLGRGAAVCRLSIARGFLPPHPSPIALIKLFGADLGLTLIYGMIVGGITLMIAGPMLALTLKKIAPRPASRETGQAPVLFAQSTVPEERL